MWQMMVGWWLVRVLYQPMYWGSPQSINWEISSYPSSRGKLKLEPNKNAKKPTATERRGISFLPAQFLLTNRGFLTFQEIHATKPPGMCRGKYLPGKHANSKGKQHQLKTTSWLHLVVVYEPYMQHFSCLYRCRYMPLIYQFNSVDILVDTAPQSSHFTGIFPVWVCLRKGYRRISILSCTRSPGVFGILDIFDHPLI